MSRYRHEYKYMLNRKQEEILKIRAGGIMLPDPHVLQDGSYQIRSLYFDDETDTCYYENENGTDPRSKFRIRYYNKQSGTMKLERKGKCRGMTEKQSCLISEAEYEDILKGDYRKLLSNTDSVKQKLILEMYSRRMQPKVIVTYERIPFVYSGGNVRVTFDRNLTSSDDTDRFLTGNYRERPVFSLGQSIMEVKWDEVLPLHLKKMMALDQLQWTSFSKYYLCRKMHL